MSNKVKVISLIKKAWHSAGHIKKGETGLVSEADAKILSALGHVEMADARTKAATADDAEVSGDEPEDEAPRRRRRPKAQAD